MDPGMTFAIIFTVIIIGVVLAFGIGQIQQFFCIGSNSQATKAVKDLEALTSEVFVLAKGSGKTYQLEIPRDIRICFINTTNPGPYPYMDSRRTWNPAPIILENILQNPSSAQYGSNLWIYFCGRPLGEGYKMKYLAPSKSFCAPDGTTLFLENKGRSVDISAPE